MVRLDRLLKLLRLLRLLKVRLVKMVLDKIWSSDLDNFFMI